MVIQQLQQAGKCETSERPSPQSRQGQASRRHEIAIGVIVLALLGPIACVSPAPPPPLNPQVASRLVSAFNQWRRFGAERQGMMKEQLHRIAAKEELSKDVGEIVGRALDE